MPISSLLRLPAEKNKPTGDVHNATLVSGDLSHNRAAAPKKMPPSIPAAGTAYDPAAALPVLEEPEAVPVPVPVLPREEVKELTLELTELTADVAWAPMLLSALLARDDRLLSSLERLLRAEASAVAATDEMLEATDEMDASSDDRSLPSDDVTDGRADAIDVISDVMSVPTAPATDVMSEAAAPATDVISPATELTSDPRSCALALNANVAMRRAGWTKCIFVDRYGMETGSVCVLQLRDLPN